MDLRIEPQNVDVNMHPTKHEVNFLYEDEIVEKIKAAFESTLIGSNETREIYTQQLLPGASEPHSFDDNESMSQKSKVYAKDMVRSDSKEQKLEKFFGTVRKNSLNESTEIGTNEKSETETDSKLNTSSQKSFILSTQTKIDVARKYAPFFR